MGYYDDEIYDPYGENAGPVNQASTGSGQAGTGSFTQGSSFANMNTQDYMQKMAERARQNVNMNTPKPSSAYYYTGSSYAAYDENAAYGAASSAVDNTYGAQYGDYKSVKPAKVKTKKEKNGSGKGAAFVKRFIAIAAAAAMFGAVAGGVFNFMSGKRLAALKESGQVSSSSGTISTANPVTTKDAIYSGVADLVDATMPSVVAITVKSIQEVPSFWGYYQEYESEGSGSGVIIGQNDTNLLVVTNYHVVKGATQVSVAFVDDQVYQADVLGTASENDLAIVTVPLSSISEDTKNQIKVISIGSSDNVRVGEQVVAIGNALGYGQSVTTGIVSALGRVNSTNVTPLIQTDAAINPGNSGGAMLNMNGELIGINSSKYASTDVEGVGYAIPISDVQDIINDIITEDEKPQVADSEKGYLGVSCGTMDAASAMYYGMPEGAFVLKVAPNSAAESAGLAPEDIITAINGSPVSSSDELLDRLSEYKIGDKVDITYKVKNGSSYREKTVTVKLTEKPEFD